jgi:hypothetical protein
VEKARDFPVIAERELTMLPLQGWRVMTRSFLKEAG